MLRKILTKLKKFLFVPRHQMIDTTLGRGIEEKTTNPQAQQQMSSNWISHQAKIRAARRRSGRY